jgi:hypothetical protein
MTSDERVTPLTTTSYLTGIAGTPNVAGVRANLAAQTVTFPGSGYTTANWIGASDEENTQDFLQGGILYQNSTLDQCPIESTRYAFTEYEYQGMYSNPSCFTQYTFAAGSSNFFELAYQGTSNDSWKVLAYYDGTVETLADYGFPVTELGSDNDTLPQLVMEEKNTSSLGYPTNLSATDYPSLSLTYGAVFDPWTPSIDPLSAGFPENHPGVSCITGDPDWSTDKFAYCS